MDPFSGPVHRIRWPDDGAPVGVPPPVTCAESTSRRAQAREMWGRDGPDVAEGTRPVVKAAGVVYEM